MIKQPIKPHVKYLFITIPSSELKKQKIGYYFFTLVTDNFNIITTTVRFTKRTLGNTVKNTFYANFANRMFELFKQYLLDNNTRVFIDKKINNKKDNHIYSYFFILKSFYKLEINTLKPLSKMIKRLDGYYKILTKGNFAKTREKRGYQDIDIYSLWKELVRRETCPWITSNIDKVFKTYTFKRRKDFIIIRIIVLYLFISNMLYNNYKKYKK